MDIKERFTEEAIEKIKEILEKNNYKSLIMKAHFDENEKVVNPIFISLNKKKDLNNIISKFENNEIFLRTAKSGQLFPSDWEIEYSEEMYSKKNIAFCLISNDCEEYFFFQDIERNILSDIDISNYFTENGIISKTIPNFEYRKEQENMANYVQNSINKNKKIIIEAGTGTGKTLAYLLPAVKWAILNERKVIIATNTINLQEQLINKDIPLIKKILNEDFSFSLVKGRNNYLCKRLFSEIFSGHSPIEKNNNFSESQKEQLKKIGEWGNKTLTGDKSELSFEVNPEVWELFQSTTEFCLGKKCPYRTSCFYIKNRKEKMEARILISNHHVFFADLNVRSKTDFNSEYLVLPRYDLVIFDEAHNIESVARNYFSLSISRISFTKFVNKICRNNNKNSQKSAMEELKNNGLIFSDSEQEKIREIESSFLEIKKIAEEYFDIFEKNFFNDKLIKNDSFQKNVREVLKSFDERDDVFDNMHPNLPKKDFKKAYNLFLDKLIFLKKSLHELYDIIKKENEDRLEVINFYNHILLVDNYIENFRFTNEFSDKNFIYWLDINGQNKAKNISITATPLNVSKILEKNLYNNIDRLIFTSATISTNENFEYFKSSIGLNKEKCIEKIINSPFDYENQMRVFIANDLASTALNSISEFILDILLTTKGKAFILFTSYRELNYVYYNINNELLENGIDIFLQGEKNRTQIIKEFKESENPVLFGTTSFWEGVDVQGKSLSNVIIVKLPFLVPTDPIVASISRKLEYEGKNSFYDFQIPEAIIKFKQGIGRLIRNKTDEGNIFILDSRIINMKYGKLFLNSIPTKNINITTRKKIIKLIEQD